MPSAFSLKLAKSCEGEFDQYHGYHEATKKMAARIKWYWQSIGKPFPGVATAWSAVFVSSFVKGAGATDEEFDFSPQHSVFVYRAIQNSLSDIGVFRGRMLSEYSPKIGDIIQNNRGGHSFDFEFASKHADYSSHSAIVVEQGEDGSGRYVRTIGGNESDTVGEHIVRLNKGGLIVQPKADPFRYICIIENRK